MLGPLLSVDPRGTWSLVQARKVLEVIQPEAKMQGLEFRIIDITTFADATTKCLLFARCIKHQHCVAYDSACEYCLDEARKT